MFTMSSAMFSSNEKLLTVVQEMGFLSSRLTNSSSYRTMFLLRETGIISRRGAQQRWMLRLQRQ